MDPILEGFHFLGKQQKVSIVDLFFFFLAKNDMNWRCTHTLMIENVTVENQVIFYTYIRTERIRIFVSF